MFEKALLLKVVKNYIDINEYNLKYRIVNVHKEVFVFSHKTGIHPVNRKIASVLFCFLKSAYYLFGTL